MHIHKLDSSNFSVTYGPCVYCENNTIGISVLGQITGGALYLRAMSKINSLKKFRDLCKKNCTGILLPFIFIVDFLDFFID